MESIPTLRKRRRTNHSNEGHHHSRGQSHERPGHRRSSSSGPHDILFNEPDLPLPDSSIWYDAPLIVAILPCLAALVFGTDLQEMILFFCICWYLHTCIRLPWSLYEMSRPRTMSKHAREKMTEAQLAAEAKLSQRSMVLLAIAFVAPFGGIMLIRKVLRAVGAETRGPYVTYFHAALFVLFGGVRPINHIAALIMGSTRELQGKVHHPPVEAETSDLMLKIERMEIIISTLTEKFRNIEDARLEDTTKKQMGMLEVQDSFEKTAARLEDGAKRREKKADMAIDSVDRRVEGLEKQYEALLSITLAQSHHANNSPEPTLRGLIIKWFEWIEAFLGLWNPWRHRSRRSTYGSGSPNGYHSPTGSRFDGRRSNGLNGLNPLNALAGSSRTSGTATNLVRRRSLDASPNLDTVVEEDPEMEDSNTLVEAAIPVGDQNATNGGNGSTVPGAARDTRRRARAVGTGSGTSNVVGVGSNVNGTGSTDGQPSTSANGSQFLRVPSEIKHRKRSAQQQQTSPTNVDA